jgi:hypothetical protein
LTNLPISGASTARSSLTQSAFGAVTPSVIAQWICYRHPVPGLRWVAACARVEARPCWTT